MARRPRPDDWTLATESGDESKSGQAPFCSDDGLDDEQIAQLVEARAAAEAEESQASTRGLGKRTLELRDAVWAIFAEFPDAMTSRQAFYQLVSAGHVENCKAGCDRVQRLLLAMRRSGDLAYDRVVDRTRGKLQRASWDGAEDLLVAGAEQFRRNEWTDPAQKVVPMIAIEKQALEAIFEDACAEYGVSLWVTRGYCSESFAFEWSTEIKRLRETGKRVAVAYFGDHDPSGLDIERDVIAKLTRFEAPCEWQRRGLLFSDFDEYGLVRVPVKRGTTAKGGDSRAKAYLERFGDTAGELDALRPDVLRERIREAIEEHINWPAWKRLKKNEEVEREGLQLVAGNWNIALAAARQGATT